MKMSQIKAIEKRYKEEFLKLNPNLNDESGIYFLTRIDEEGFKFAYIGQAVRILTRLSQHMTGYQHIDLSLKSHGLYSEGNIYGWKVGAINYDYDQLDQMEKYWIKKYALSGYQMRNKTIGGQGKGKTKLGEYREPRGYYDGLENGKKKCSKDISHLFELHLNVTTKNDPPTKNQVKALEKFNYFLDLHKES